MRQVKYSQISACMKRTGLPSFWLQCERSKVHGLLTTALLILWYTTFMKLDIAQTLDKQSTSKLLHVGTSPVLYHNLTSVWPDPKTEYTQYL